jgi:hypothetical protein
VSALDGHIKAARITGEAFIAQAREMGSGSPTIVHNMGLAFLRAAQAMEAQARAECSPPTEDYILPPGQRPRKPRGG